MASAGPPAIAAPRACQGVVEALGSRGNVPALVEQDAAPEPGLGYRMTGVLHRFDEPAAAVIPVYPFACNLELAEVAQPHGGETAHRCDTAVQPRLALCQGGGALELRDRGVEVADLQQVAAVGTVVAHAHVGRECLQQFQGDHPLQDVAGELADVVPHQGLQPGQQVGERGIDEQVGLRRVRTQRQVLDAVHRRVQVPAPEQAPHHQGHARGGDFRFAQKLHQRRLVLDQVGNPGPLAAAIMASEAAKGVPPPGRPTDRCLRQVGAEERTRIAKMKGGLLPVRVHLPGVQDLLLDVRGPQLSLLGLVNLLQTTE